jgi:hypothetical protein
MVIGIIWNNGRPAKLHDLFRSTRILKGKVALSAGEVIDVSFQLKLSKTDRGKKQLEVKLLSAGYRLTAVSRGEEQEDRKKKQK